MNDLLVKSFKAQTKWISKKMANQMQRYEFNSMVEWIIRNNRDFDNTPTKIQQTVIDIYNETRRNLIARFETGIPIESWSIDE